MSETHAALPPEWEPPEMGQNGNTGLLQPLTAVRYSESLGKLAEALAAAQLEFTPVFKGSENTAYRRGNYVSKYADLSAVIEATRTALAKHGLVVIQLPQVDHAAKMLKMTTKLLHSSGEWIENDLVVPATQQQQNRYDIQSIGSAMTYTRRYAWQAIVGVAAEEDDDGNAAAGVGSKEAQQSVAEAKTSGATPALFYTWFDESQTASITGTANLLTNKGVRSVLDKLAPWNPKVGAFVANGEGLESCKFEFEKRGIPFKQLKANG